MNSTVPAEKASEAEHSELLALYSSSVGEISGFKSQQLAITNYVVIVFAALVAASKY